MENKINIGKKFGRWTVNGEEFRIKNHKYYSCICDCGKEKNVEKYSRKRSNPCTYKYSEKFDITIIIQLHKLYDFNKLYNSYNYHKFFRGL